MATEARCPNYQRYLILAWACIVITVSGSVASFINYATDLKDEFQLEQKTGIIT